MLHAERNNPSRAIGMIPRIGGVPNQHMGSLYDMTGSRATSANPTGVTVPDFRSFDGCLNPFSSSVHIRRPSFIEKTFFTNIKIITAP